MSLELPALSAVIARLPNPDINLAAYGGVVFPLALILESPIIMLLAASTALSKDCASYQRLLHVYDEGGSDPHSCAHPGRLHPAYIMSWWSGSSARRRKSSSRRDWV